MCVSPPLAARKARLRNGGRLPRKNVRGPFLQKSSGAQKRRECARTGTYLCWQQATALRQAPRASRKLRRRRATPQHRCLWFYRCCAQTNCVRRRAACVLHGSPPNRSRAVYTVARPERIRTPQPSSGARNRSGRRGRSIYPTASSQPTARGRAPARLRALERAPWRTPNPGLLLDHILYFWICRLLSSPCC